MGRLFIRVCRNTNHMRQVPWRPEEGVSFGVTGTGVIGTVSYCMWVLGTELRSSRKLGNELTV